RRLQRLRSTPLCRAAVVPTGVFGATEDFGAGTAQGADDGTPPIAVRVDRAARELAPLVSAREAREQANPFGEPTPFERLLAGGRSEEHTSELQSREN